MSMSWLLGEELIEGWEGTSLTHAYTKLGASSMGGAALGGLIARSIGPVYGPLGLGRRGAAKVFVEGFAVRIAEGVAALLLLLWLVFGSVPKQSLAGTDSRWIRYLLLLAVVAWVVAALRMRRMSTGRTTMAVADDSYREVHPPDCCPITVSLGQELVGSTPPEQKHSLTA